MASSERTTGKANIFILQRKKNILVNTQLCSSQFRVNLQYGDSSSKRYTCNGENCWRLWKEFPVTCHSSPVAYTEVRIATRHSRHQHEIYALHFWLHFSVLILLSESRFSLICKRTSKCRPGLPVTCWLKSFFQNLSPIMANTTKAYW